MAWFQREAKSRAPAIREGESDVPPPSNALGKFDVIFVQNVFAFFIEVDLKIVNGQTPAISQTNIDLIHRIIRSHNRYVHASDGDDKVLLAEGELANLKLAVEDETNLSESRQPVVFVGNS